MTLSIKQLKLLAVAATLGAGIGLAHPAKADWDGHGGDGGPAWHDQGWHDQGWHDQGWHDQGWHDHWRHHWGWGYAPPPVYYAPPRVYYVPPPVYAPPPPVYYTQPGY